MANRRERRAVAAFIFTRNNGPLYDALLEFVNGERPAELSKYRAGEILSNQEFRRLTRSIDDWLDTVDVF